MRPGILVQDDTRIEQPIRIHETLELMHDLQGVFTPFDPDERSHVAPRAVFRFQRAVMLPADHVHDQRVDGYPGRDLRSGVYAFARHAAYGTDAFPY